MKYIKSHKIFGSDMDKVTDQIRDIKDMFLELKDVGFNIGYDIRNSNNFEIEIGYNSDDYQVGHYNNHTFTMKDDLKEFLFRIKDYMNGWKMKIHSNHGYLYILDDGRISSVGHTLTERYPGLTRLKINFSK